MNLRNTIKRVIQRPLVSVIVPCWNGEKSIERAVRSALNQSLRAIEVLVVDAGSTDRSAAIVQRLASRDSRVRLFSFPTRRGPGEARNLGIAKARGKYLTFLDADDKVLPGAYEALVSSLRASGSDYAMGGYQRHDASGYHRPEVVKRVHNRTRTAITVADFPLILDEPVLWNKMFRREFWMKSVGSIPEDRNYEDQEPCLLAALNAQAIDVLSQDVYSWRLPGNRDTRSQSKREVHDLKDRITVVDNMLALSANAPRDVRRHLLSTVLGRDLVMYLEQVPYTADEYWEELHRLCERLADQFTEELWREIPVQNRVLAYLGARGTHQDIEAAVGARQEYTMAVPWTMCNNSAQATIPYANELSVPLTPFLLQHGPHDLSIRAQTWSLEWNSDEQLTVSGYAYVPGIDVATTKLAWHLQVLDSEQRMLSSHPIATWQSDAWADIEANDPWRTYATSGFTEAIAIPSAAATIVLSVTIGDLPQTLTCPLPYPLSARETTQSPSENRQCISGSDGQTLIAPSVSSLHTTQALASPSVPKLEVHQVELDGAELHLSGTMVDVGHDGIQLALVSSHEVFLLSLESEGPHDSSKWQSWHAVADLSCRKLSSHGYFLRFSTGPTISWVDVRPKRSARTAAPLRLDGPVRSATITTHRGRSLGITIGPPIPQQFRSRYARQQLQEAAPPPIFDAIVFETFSGKSTGDNPGALYETLQELKVGFPCYWSVIDGTVTVPPEATRLIIGTPEWFKVVRSACLLITNNNFPIYFQKSPGQYWLQTWHGTPIKRLLFDAPKASIPLLYRRLMTRQVPWWNLLLAQSEEAAKNLCTAMRYNGPVMITEQPRNKRLFQPGLREQTRERLGISPNEHVILYAPTWRERYKETRGTTPDYLLDPQQLSLEKDCTVLVRMHHMNNAAIPESPRVIDVSDEPYIEDLMCASDELISDYSSAIVDYRLLGRPIRSAITDTEHYIAFERGLYDRM